MLSVFMGVATIAFVLVVVAMCFAFKGFLDFLGSGDMDEDDEKEGDR